MFNQNNNEEKKLDWMYKGATSTVDREEYLLGRSVDKTLEQINEEEKQNKLGAAAPAKSKVEHECIPPSIRDFNKVVQAEQVDLSAKLQEDPLVAIKKREEETRRQFLQNPVQLKKLQKALKAQQAKQNKKKKKKKKKKGKDSDDSDSDNLNVKLTAKLLGKKSKKISKEERDLDTILIHKYEEFKDKLSDSDIRDILDGKFTDSEEDMSNEDSAEEEYFNKGDEKNKSKHGISEDVIRTERRQSKSAQQFHNNRDNQKSLNYKDWERSDYHRNKEQYRNRNNSPNYFNLNVNREKSHYKRDVDRKTNNKEEYEKDRQKGTRSSSKHSSGEKKKKEHKRGNSSSSNSSEDRKRDNDKDGRKRSKDARHKSAEREYYDRKKEIKRTQQNSSRDTDYTQKRDKEDKTADKRHMSRSKSPKYEKRGQRDEKRRNRSSSSSNEEDNKRHMARHYESDDSDSSKYKKRSYGLVNSEGKKITLNKNRQEEKAKTISKEPETPKQKPQHKAKKMTEEEKERLRKEMMDNAAWRDKERSHKVKKYRETEEKESKQEDFDPEFMHKQLVRSTQSSSVESRIKSNLNKIQRSSRDMNTNFSRR